MYNKLLISAGGGIISRDQQAEQNDAATIAIGLGGTGVSCLRALKKEVYTRLKPDASDSPIPTYRHIKFLAIDTDKSSLGDTGSIDTLDSNTEFLDLSCADIGGLLAGAATLKNNPSLQWLKAAATQPDGVGIEIQSAEAGAGGVRQIGRLLLLQNCNAFITKLNSIITEARRELPAGAELNIHIFTGIGGGTGAGTFLDVCYLTQHVLQSLGLQGSAQTCGYFFMPDVNIDRVSDAKVREYIKSNGFASMKELDYCMNFATNGGEWKQIYDGFSFQTTNPPVKLAHLISATTESGALVDDAYNYAMHVAVDYVMDFLVKPVVDETGTDNPFTIKSHISNIRNIINMTNKTHGAPYEYCILGASNAYLPYKEITTYLASKIFEGFKYLNKQLPGPNDIDLFVEALGLKYEDITRALNNAVPTVPNYEVDARTLYDQVAGISSNVIPQLLGQMRDSIAKVSGKLTENKKALLDDIENTNVDATKAVTSMIVRVKRKLLEIASQADKGPYYASAFLHTVNTADLQNKIDGYIKTNNDNLQAATGDLSLRDRTIENTLRELQNSNIINRKAKARDYAQAVNSYYRQQAKIELYTVMADILDKFKKQISELYSSHYSIFEIVLRNLEQTFDANLTSLAKIEKQEKGYAVKLMSIHDLQDSLDSAVKAMKINDLISNFVTYMIGSPEVWIAQDETKISTAVSEFFLKELKEFTGRTIIDYLKIKFETEDPNLISKKVYDEIVMPMASKAQPLFWIDGSKYQVPADSELGFCSIPQISAEIKTAAEKFETGHKTIKTRPSYNTDRISFLIFKCGIPMYGYKGVDNYRGAKRVTGAHLYEGAVGDSRDWRSLNGITPYSCINDNDLTDVLKEKAKTFDKAFAAGVVARKDVGDDGRFDYVLYEYDNEKIAKMKEAIDTVIKSGDIEKCKSVKAAVDAEEVPVKSYSAIKNTGAPMCEDLVVRDIFIASEVLMEKLEKGLESFTERATAISTLENAINQGGAYDTAISEFAMAVMTGAIKKIDNYSYAFVTQTYGIEDVKELTNINTTPYGMALPLYSAFVNYFNLETETKSAISDLVKVNLTTDTAKVDEALAEVKALLAPEKVNGMMQVAKLNFSSDFEKIAEFCKKMAAQLVSFSAMRP